MGLGGSGTYNACRTIRDIMIRITTRLVDDGQISKVHRNVPAPSVMVSDGNAKHLVHLRNSNIIFVIVQHVNKIYFKYTRVFKKKKGTRTYLKQRFKTIWILSPFGSVGLVSVVKNHSDRRRTRELFSGVQPKRFSAPKRKTKKHNITLKLLQSRFFTHEQHGCVPS